MENTPGLNKYKSLSDSDKEIMSKYINKDIPVIYGHNRLINIDNELFYMDKLDEKTKGFFIWLSTYKQLDRESNKIIVPRLSINWMIKKIGLKPRSDYAAKTFNKMLKILQKSQLIRIIPNSESFERNDIFTVEILNATKKYEYFTQVYLGNIDMIIKTKIGFNSFKYCLAYAAIRSFVTESKEDTKVVTIRGCRIRDRMNVGKTTYYNRLNWLKDNHIIALFQVQMINDYGNQKMLISDIRDVKNMVLTINDWKEKKQIACVIS